MKQVYYRLSRYPLGVVFLVTVLAFGLAFVNYSQAFSMPLPTSLIAEKTLTTDQEKVEFDDIIKQAPSGSQHLYIEVFSAVTGGDSKPAAVTLTLNGDNNNSYTNRTLFAEGETVDTVLESSSEAATLMYIPSADRDNRRFGGGWAFAPYAFLDSHNKHLLAQGAANENYVTTQMAHWDSRRPISSIQLQVEGSFAAGSTFRLHVVDERYKLHETVLDKNAPRFSFFDIPQNHGNLLVVGQTRSSEVNPQRRGDRVWYSINDDTERSHYQIQRITGESDIYRQGQELELNRLLVDRMPEPRIGWNSAASAPSGVFGPWMLYYPEYANTDMWRTFLSRHGTHDNHYNPIGNEIGRWTSSDSIRGLSFFPQGGEEFEVGSRVGVYRTKQPSQRHVVARGGEQVISLDVPRRGDELQLHVAARSEHTQDEDQLLIEFNEDSDESNYIRQRATGLDGEGEAVRKLDNEIGVLSSGDTPQQLLSSTQVSLNGLCGDSQTSLASFGGVAGDGRIALYGGRWKRADSVERITLRTKSGAAFSAGSVFTAWADESPSGGSDAKHCLANSSSTNRVVEALAVAVFLMLVLVLLQAARRRKSGS